ncbi:hypothetical protein DIPPA_08769 [Diplonema papillatum]|nr:hypothetical protein DIPPA_08769 [Diplonema papillatum]
MAKQSIFHCTQPTPAPPYHSQALRADDDHVFLLSKQHGPAHVVRVAVGHDGSRQLHAGKPLPQVQLDRRHVEDGGRVQQRRLALAGVLHQVGDLHVARYRVDC